MKKILFILSDLERGGIPRVTINLIAALDPQKISADIFCCNPRGIFLEEIKELKHVRFLSQSLLLRAITCNYRKERGWFKYYAICIKIFRVCMNGVLKKNILGLLTRSIGKNLSVDNYDAVFAVHEGLPADLCLAVKSKMRGVWLHTDYDHDNGVNVSGLREKLYQFDKIICVAEHARISLCRHFPELSSKALTIYNIVNANEILEKAKQQITDPAFHCGDVCTVLSIGRFFDFQKRFSMIPAICADLIKRKCIFRWYLIGNGSQEEESFIRQAAEKAALPEGCFVLLGEKKNPYPYLRKVSCLALTSAYETYPTVINEANVLGVPVICTDFKGVEEIVDNHSCCVTPIENFADTLEQTILHFEPDYRRKINHFAEHNAAVLEHFYKMINV